MDIDKNQFSDLVSFPPESPKPVHSQHPEGSFPTYRTAGKLVENASVSASWTARPLRLLSSNMGPVACSDNNRNLYLWHKDQRAPSKTEVPTPKKLDQSWVSQCLGVCLVLCRKQEWEFLPPTMSKVGVIFGATFPKIPRPKRAKKETTWLRDLNLFYSPPNMSRPKVGVMLCQKGDHTLREIFDSGCQDQVDAKIELFFLFSF